jgi:hypothetical protein
LDRCGSTARIQITDKTASAAVDSIISITCRPLPQTYTTTGCLYVAEATIDGMTYSARSRHGAPNALARHLLAKGITDQGAVITYEGVAGGLYYRSLHAMARWTFTEGNFPLSRVRWQPRQNAFSAETSDQGDERAIPKVSQVPPKTQAVLEASKISVTCQGCGRPFTP